MTDTEQKHTPLLEDPDLIIGSSDDGHFFVGDLEHGELIHARTDADVRYIRDALVAYPALKAKVKEQAAELKKVTEFYETYKSLAEAGSIDIGDLQSQIATMKERDDWTLKNIDRALDELAEGKFQCVNYTLSNLVKFLQPDGDRQ